MKILNAGLEKVEFGFNQNAKDKRLGGFYTLMPGETAEIPEEARSLILNHESGPKNYGVVILEFGTDLRDAQLEGLQNFVAFKNLKVEREQQRVAEKLQNGHKIFGKPKPLRLAEEALAKAVEALEKFESQGEAAPISKAAPLPVSGSSQRTKIANSDEDFNDLEDVDDQEEDSDGDIVGDGEQGQAESW